MTIDQKALIEAIERLRVLDQRAGAPIVAAEFDRGLTIAQAMALRRAEREAALRAAEAVAPPNWGFDRATFDMLHQWLRGYVRRFITAARRWR